MKVIAIDVYPVRLTRGWTLYQQTFYDEMIPMFGKRLNKSKRRVWPECKMENGRGKVFETPRKAMLFYLEHKGDFPIEEGTWIWKRLRRMKLI